MPVKSTLTGTTTFLILTIRIILLTLPVLRIVSTEKVEAVLSTEETLS
jgi:hypothetical protein